MPSTLVKAALSAAKGALKLAATAIFRLELAVLGAASGGVAANDKGGAGPPKPTRAQTKASTLEPIRGPLRGWRVWANSCCIAIAVG